MNKNKKFTDSDIEIDGVYSASSPNYQPPQDAPGEFPYTRGVQADMYRGKLWTMRQYAGFSTAEESNKRYHYLLSQGVSGLSVAFDLPTQIGYDSDHKLAEGEVGKVGVFTSMTLQLRAEYFSERKDNDKIANALLLQKTVFDPETEELILKKLSLDDINNLPTYVTDPLVKVALQAIGVTPEMISQKATKETESQELKNSENDQS